MRWIATVWIVVGVVGCGNQTDPEAARAARLENQPAQVEQPATAPKPVVAAPVLDSPVDLPAECTAYREMSDKLATCERLGEMREVLRSEFNRSWQAWAALPRDARAEVAAQCKRAADNLLAAVAASCGW